MPKLSMNHAAASSSSPSAARDAIHVPFVAHIRIVPSRTSGKRIEIIRNIEKKALRAEVDLITAGFNIATPLAFTPQIGDYEARLTIVGFVTKYRNADLRTNEAPTTDISVIHSGTDPDEKTSVVQVNKGGSLASGQDTTSVVDAEVKELRMDLAAGTTEFSEQDVIAIEYNGVKYGTKKQGARSFPR
mgnify:CR=1 FL=1|tara:strand:+ start:21 stop:584 length:564 start_codon:yes stop_codon:yes gene_type:complete